MIKILNKEKCSGCGACAQSCSLNCIQLKTDKEGFWYPSVDTNICVNCGRCEKVCPCLNESVSAKIGNTEVLGVKNNSDEVRFNSSSGGVFTALAKQIFNMNGIVFGVAMSADNKTAHHIQINSIEEIHRLQGSKYIQSEVGNAYIETKNHLDNGKFVLFSGAPCQIKALNLFLGKEYDNLITAEVICHGVPSTLLWHKYVNYIESTTGSIIEKVNFRSKKYGWKSFGTAYCDRNRKYVFKFHFEDPFFRLFLKNICLRPSCYDCLAKDGKSGADISLGDFWGIEKVAPNFDDNRGVSMVLIHTKKGRVFFDSVAEDFEFLDHSLEYDFAVQCNPAIACSPKYHASRNVFFNDMNTMSFKQLSTKYVPSSSKIKIKSILMRHKMFRKFGGGNS